MLTTFWCDESALSVQQKGGLYVVNFLSMLFVLSSLRTRSPQRSGNSRFSSVSVRRSVERWRTRTSVMKVRNFLVQSKLSFSIRRVVKSRRHPGTRGLHGLETEDHGVIIHSAPPGESLNARDRCLMIGSLRFNSKGPALQRSATTPHAEALLPLASQAQYSSERHVVVVMKFSSPNHDDEGLFKKVRPQQPSDS